MQKVWCNRRPVYAVVHFNYYPVAIAPGFVLVDPLRFVKSQECNTRSLPLPDCLCRPTAGADLQLLPSPILLWLPTASPSVPNAEPVRDNMAAD